MHATRFVGREADLFRLEELLSQGQRLVRLWGSAGIGKSRLAAQYVQLARHERKSIACADVTAARDVADVCVAVGAALGVPAPIDAGEREDARWIERALAAWGGGVLVVDGADAIAAPSAALVASWVGSMPELRVLITSRQRLGTDGELAYEVLPLIEAEAVDLFCDRARLVRPDFQVDERCRASVADIVRRLDRVPLAIEVAAARIDVLGLDGIARRLGDALAVPALRAAIQSSWELLGPAERAVLAHSTVFRDGFTLEAAEAVVALDDPAGSVFDALCSLRDKSLLRTERVGEGVRFDAFEGVRAFARERLGADARVDAEGRHTRYFLRLGEDVDDLGRLARDRENLRAVHGRALADGRIDDALRAALALDRVAAVRGAVHDHLAMLDDTLGAACGDDAAVLAVVRARGNARRLRGDLDGAARDLERAAASEDDALAAAASADLGLIYHQRREMSDARRQYEHALDRARRARCRGTEARVLGNLAALDHDGGAYANAERRYRDALAIFADLGDARHEGIFLANLAILEHEQARHDDARTHFRAALRILGDVGDDRLMGIALANLGALEHTDGNLEESRNEYERALALLETTGELRSEALCRGRLAAVVAALGDVSRARAELDIAERQLERVGDRVGFGAVQLARGFIELTEASRERAAGHAERAAALLERVEQRVAEAKAGATALTGRSDDARALTRILEHGMEELDGAWPADALIVGPEARWFRGPRGQWHDLTKRTALRLILLHLTEMRRAMAGTGVSVGALQRAGWPDEKMTAEAGSNRVYVALNKLRKLGLDGVLIRSEAGYLLHPDVTIERIATHWRAVRDEATLR